MKPGGEVVVDANLVINLALASHPFHVECGKFFAECARLEMRLISPPWWMLEADNSLRRMAHGGQLPASIAQEAQTVLNYARIESLLQPGARVLSHQLADRLHQIRVGDASYIALAQLRGCDFWTADLRLVNNAQSAGLNFVRSIADYR